MSETTKTVLIVGGVAVGSFLVLRMLAPSPAFAARQQQQTTAGSVITGIAGILPSIITAIGSSRGGGVTTDIPPSPGHTVGYDTGESFEDFYSGMFGPGIPLRE